MLRADVAAAYDERAEEYIAKLGSVSQMEPQDLVTIDSWSDGVAGRILDAGSGPGHWSDVLSSGGRRDVVGVDASVRLATSARDRFPDAGFLVGDLAALPVATGSVGGILAWFSIIHTPPEGLPEIVREFARVLVPGGSVLVGFFDGEAGTPFGHAVTTAYFWTAEALGQLLAREGFVVETAAARQDPGLRPQGHLIATRERDRARIRE
ncbi:class I SAM-dependent methyltransferase [Aeromicrobium chenweiae]|uniref:SAM-dependent methyltransferase n=1 Tax=Aeromicrobium chenweiae TaxID=2079793 RepID=A0A2S0WLC2_9ACTN|nr:class I SAM-dependent methyltransferase [Aeromicrobium chenweiae]AWB92116.1 SAM-dependent methyltransferase [Aeromicrobium chenweiae]TGN32966.1 class I SAM-dependent methyltransferase [Aeromicrobium chenweiae]